MLPNHLFFSLITTNLFNIGPTTSLTFIVIFIIIRNFTPNTAMVGLVEIRYTAYNNLCILLHGVFIFEYW